MNQSIAGSIIDIKRFSIHDGPGIRTTVFLKGCPLRCIWCHNPEGISDAPELCYFEKKCVNCGQCVVVCPHNAHRMVDGKHVFKWENCNACGLCTNVCLGDALTLYGEKMTADEVVAVVMEDEPFYRETGGGMTLSGGEPLLQAAYCAELLRLVKQRGLHTAVDTCGAVPWAFFKEVLPLTDLFLYDIKHMDTALHSIYTGAGNERIHDNLRRLAKSGAAIEIRIPLIPGYNDDDANIDATGTFLSGIAGIEKVVILPYHSLARSKYLALGLADTMPHTASPSDETLRKTAERLRAFGLNTASGRD